MRIFSRLRIAAFAAATVTALALGACATDEDLGSDEAALAAADDEASPADLAPVASSESSLSASVGLFASCPCSGAYARCSGEATGGNGSYVIKFTNLNAGTTATVPNSGGTFSFGTGMNHGSLRITATSGGSSFSRTYNVSCSSGGGGGGNPL